MAALTTNPILPVVATIVVVAAGASAYVVSRDANGVRLVDSQGRVRVEPPREADADTTSDTITALSGMVDGLNETVAQVTSHNEALVAEKARIEAESSAQLESIRNGIRQEMAKVGDSNRDVMQQMTEQFKAMQQQIRDLEKDLAAAQKPAVQPPSSQTDRSRFSPLSDLLNGGVVRTDTDAGRYAAVEIVPGIGLDSLASGRVVPATDLIDFVWIDPLDRPSEPSSILGVPDGSRQDDLLLASLGRRIPAIPSASDLRVAKDEPATDSRPASSGGERRVSDARDSRESTADTGQHFTLPDLSIMTGAISLTALVGRIYIDQEITDPWPFKTLIGRENLTANYHDLPPEIDGMLYEGYGVGDWTLSCVRGWITVASFVFADGTVLPAYADSPGTREERHRLNRDAIGYISDPHGNPCVLGERLTNAPGYLGSRMLAAAATGYAEALNADNEIRSSTINPDGSVNTVQSVISASGTYAAREAYADAFREGARWIRERQAQSFDAIFVPSGAEVVVNLQAELRLDKRPDARRISYSAVKEGRRHALD